MINYLETLQSKHAIVPIHEASSNVVIICKKYYVEVVIGYESHTCCKAGKFREDIIPESNKETERLVIQMTRKKNTLPSMHWIPKCIKIQYVHALS